MATASPHSRSRASRRFAEGRAAGRGRVSSTKARRARRRASGSSARTRLRAAGHAHRAVLFRDDDAERVRALREPQRGRVTRPVRPDLREVGGQRQVDSESADTAGLHDRGSVVARRVGIEEAEQQRLRDGALQREAALEERVQRVPPGEHDQGAPACRGEAEARAHDVLEQDLPGGRGPAPDAEDGEALEEALQVVLEGEDEHDRRDQEEPLKEPGRQGEADLPRGEVDEADDAHAGEGQPRPGAAEHPQQDEDRHRDDGDVRRLVEEREQQGRQAHGPASPARRKQASSAS